MKAKNLKQFKALIERYETITLEEIEKVHDDFYMYATPNTLTGFGNNLTCSLCSKDNKIIDCVNCVYNIRTSKHCNEGVNLKTFAKIVYAETPKSLLKAFRARAKHMKTLLK